MKMTITQVQINMKNKLHHMRNLDYFVNTIRFEKAYEEANEKELYGIDHALKSNNLIVLRNLCNQILRKDLTEKPLSELREIASRKGIPNFNRFTKNGLIYLIKEHMKNEKRRSRTTSREMV